MATRTKPLITAAAFASAAAIAVASPAIAPNLAPAPNALSAAQVDLTSFATLLSLTYDDYVTAFFQGYGYTLQPNQPDNPDWAAAYVGTGCNFSCAVVGPSGMAYMALDALLTGNTPQTPQKDVNVAAVNYFFEGGFSSGAQYLVSAPFANPASPLYNPNVAGAISLAFQGAYALTTLYIKALDTVALLAYNGVPVLGPYIYGGIQAYLGPNTVDEFYGSYGLYAGLSGLLDWALLGFPVLPPPPTAAAAAASPRTVAALATSALAATSAATDVVSATPTATEAVSATPASVKAEVAVPKAGDTPAAEATSADSTPADSTPAVSGSTEAVAETAPADTTPADTTPADTTPADTTPADTKPADTKPADTKPADTKPADTKPAVDSPSSAVADTTPAATKPVDAPAKASRQPRPVRSAVERATKKIASAIGGAAAKAAPAAGGSADSAASAG
jgi:hypothetical protein